MSAVALSGFRCSGKRPGLAVAGIFMTALFVLSALSAGLAAAGPFQEHDGAASAGDGQGEQAYVSDAVVSTAPPDGSAADEWPSAVGAAEADVDGTTGETDEEDSFDLSADTQSFADGRMIRMLIPRTKAEALSKNLSDIRRIVPGVVVNFVPVGNDNYVVISGADASEVRRAQNRIAFILGIEEASADLIIDISAILKQYSESEAKSLGIPILPVTIAPSLTVSQLKWYFGPNKKDAPQSIDAITVTTSDNYEAIQLLDHASSGRVMVSGNVAAHNGTMCTISSTDNVPVLVSQNGSIATTNQRITTSINVTPAIISYDKQDPAKSVLRLDINLQASVITKTNDAGVSFTQKNLVTRRILQANGLPAIAGSFVSDERSEVKSYVPILGQLPLVEYLFSSQNTISEHSVSVLFLTARVLPKYAYEEDDLSNIKNNGVK
ncbi:MAG: type II and III secretion system protein [Negativicutes bacterium]|nr:type II and III secretion system protein [Negativicutes bacterium]